MCSNLSRITNKTVKQTKLAAQQPHSHIAWCYPINPHNQLIQQVCNRLLSLYHIKTDKKKRFNYVVQLENKWLFCCLLGTYTEPDATYSWWSTKIKEKRPNQQNRSKTHLMWNTPGGIWSCVEDGTKPCRSNSYVLYLANRRLNQPAGRITSDWIAWPSGPSALSC